MSAEDIQPVDQQQDKGKKQRRHVWMLSMLVVGMFGFGFAMVPLYQLICSVAGINSISTGGRVAVEVENLAVDPNREITVEFDVTHNKDIPWEFRPMVQEITVHPGEVNEVMYFAKNNSDQTIVAQAVPGVTPWQATEHLKKLECFCFSRQELAPGESREMPLRFVVTDELPDKFRTITLSYTIMDTDLSNVSE